MFHEELESRLAPTPIIPSLLDFHRAHEDVRQPYTVVQPSQHVLDHSPGPFNDTDEPLRVTEYSGREFLDDLWVFHGKVAGEDHEIREATAQFSGLFTASVPIADDGSFSIAVEFEKPHGISYVQIEHQGELSSFAQHGL